MTRTTSTELKAEMDALEAQANQPFHPLLDALNAKVRDLKEALAQAEQELRDQTKARHAAAHAATKHLEEAYYQAQANERREAAAAAIAADSTPPLDLKTGLTGFEAWLRKQVEATQNPYTNPFDHTLLGKRGIELVKKVTTTEAGNTVFGSKARHGTTHAYAFDGKGRFIFATGTNMTRTRPAGPCAELARLQLPSRYRCQRSDVERVADLLVA